MAFETYQFMASHLRTESPAEAMARCARLAAEKQDRDDAREEVERQLAIDDAAEARAIAAMQAGLATRSLGEVFAEAERAGDEDSEYAEALAVIERIDRRRERRQREMADQAQRMAAVSRPVPATGVEGAVTRAQEALREERSRRKVEAMLAQRPASRERRPFARGRVAVRSEQVECAACAAVGTSPEESFLIHHADADGNPLSVSQDVPVPVPPDEPDGYRYGSYPESVISR